MGQHATCVWSQSGWSDLRAREGASRVKVLHMSAALADAPPLATADAAADAAEPVAAAALAPADGMPVGALSAVAVQGSGCQREYLLRLLLREERWVQAVQVDLV